MTLLEIAVARLSDEVEILRMVEALPAIGDWKEYGLTKHEAKMLTAIRNAGNRGLTHSNLVMAVYADKPVTDWPDSETLKVFMCRIRKKLKQSKATFAIETIHGEGYKWREGRGV